MGMCGGDVCGRGLKIHFKFRHYCTYISHIFAIWLKQADGGGVVKSTYEFQNEISVVLGSLWPLKKKFS